MIRLRQQRGAALFVGIFLITVVVLFAAVVALTSSTQQLSQARAGLAEGAWYAAVARMETAVQYVVNNDACPPGGASAFAGYSTTLNCSVTSVSEGGRSYGVYSLEAGASQGNLGTAVFVRRSIRGQVTDLDG
jgi:hypothetical protein